MTRSRKSKKHHHPKTRKLSLLKFSDVKIEVPPVSQSIQPGDDFQSQVNQIWMRNVSIPETKFIYSSTDEVEARLDHKLAKILTRAQTSSIRGTPVRSRADKQEDALGRLILSSMRQEKQKYSVDYLKQGVRKMGCMRNLDDLASTLGQMARQNIPTLLRVSPIMDHQEDRKNRVTQKLMIEPGGLGLPDPRYQKGEGPGKTRTLQKQVELLQTLSKKFEPLDLTQAIQLEAELSLPMEASKHEPTRDLPLSELSKNHPDFPWDAFFTGLGIPHPHSHKIYVLLQSDPWIHYVSHMMKKVPMDDWIRLLSLHTILHALPYLPPPFDDLHFRFQGKEMRGQVKKLPQKDLTLDFCKRVLTPWLGELQKKEYLPPSTKMTQEKFVKAILLSAMDRISKVKWLSKPSIRRSIQKIESMELCISYSDEKWDDPPALRSDNFLQNLQILEDTNSHRRQSRLGNLANPSEVWDEGIYQANAQYQTETNQLVVPAGMFEQPFYQKDHAKHRGWNYGGIGAAIGHEITHAFDEEGRQFDEIGQQKPWWSASDIRHQKEKTKKLVQLQEEPSFHGKKVNGSTTLSENLADLGGLVIALHALQNEMKQEKCSEEEVQHHLREFFHAQAVSWRTKIRPKQAVQSLFLDKHAPAEQRVNQVVRHIDEWQEIFGVTTPAELQLPPEERIRIF